jgi:hypothetical protein
LLFLASQTFVFTAAQFAAPSSEGEQQGAAAPGQKKIKIWFGVGVLFITI